MNILENLFYKQQLIELQVPSRWIISKNNLIKIDLQWLNNLEKEKKFNVREVYLSGNVFSAKFLMDYDFENYNFILTSTAKNQSDSENNIISLNYDLEILLSKGTKKIKK